jgi:hypothetical protein
MYVLEDEAKQYEHIISWSKDGLSFIIHDTSQLEKEVLPNIFKDAKFSSFLRKVGSVVCRGFLISTILDDNTYYIMGVGVYLEVSVSNPCNILIHLTPIILLQLYRWGFIKRPLKDNACAYINPVSHT